MKSSEDNLVNYSIGARALSAISETILLAKCNSSVQKTKTAATHSALDLSVAYKNDAVIIARWFVPKFANGARVRAYTFCIYVLHIQLASIVENGEAVQVGCGATWAVQVRSHNKGTRQRARLISELTNSVRINFYADILSQADI